MRNYGTHSNGGGFDLTTLRLVWNKAHPVQGYNPDFVRRDDCGAWIEWKEYGTTNNTGWEVDHIRPVSLGGSDAAANLQPLHWQNNRGKSDNYPRWTCALQG